MAASKIPATSGTTSTPGMGGIVTKVISVDAIGDVAGRIWKELRTRGPRDAGSIVRAVGASEGEVHEGLGWLAREGKLRIDTRAGTYGLSDREMSVKV
jgi:hypothetical protein